MKIIKIKKKNGSYRTVISPDDNHRDILKNLLGNLNNKTKSLCCESVHGFIPGKSPVTAAKCHIGYEYTISMDLKDFFDSVTPKMVSKYLNQEELQHCFVDIGDGSGLIARQGLSTSPAIANLAFMSTDAAILKFFKKINANISYTRYADDLTFSYNDRELTPIIFSKIPDIISRGGFKLNKSKTRYMPAKAGNRVICGISVGINDIYPTRSSKKKLRAAKHNLEKDKTNKNYHKFNGNSAWCSLRTPNVDKDKITDNFQVADKLIKFWRLKGLSLRNYKNHLKYNNEIIEMIDGDFMITSDPAYILGMSAYTTGWTSCMSPTGNFFPGVRYWLLASSKIACLTSDSEKTFGGVTRKAMKSRCLVHAFRNGERGYDRIYGDPANNEKLKEKLESMGYVHVSKIASGTKIVGNVPVLKNPYFDNLKHVKVKLKDSGRQVYVLQTM